MYLFRILEIGSIFLSLSSSFAQKVSYDFDKNAKFSQFKTYRWVMIANPMLTEILRKAMPRRYRLNVSSLSLLLLGNDGPIVPLEDSRVMKNDKLQSTTVRFTDSDLYLIERLQEKLGLDMFSRYSARR
jgi:CRP-like cAMP-binding protein